MSDVIDRFLFDGTDVRGELVRVSDALSRVTEGHDYPAPVAKLLGEMVAAVLLLSGTIKFQGKLVLQARSEGQLPLAMAEATHDKKVRAIARLDEQVSEVSESFSELLKGGTLVVTIDREQGERYQSLVPLTGSSLAECIETYFAQSEQLGTRMILTSEDGVAAGLLLQQLPVQLVQDETTRERQWEHLVTLGQTVSGKELLSMPTERLLGLLYAEDDVRMMDRTQVQFECSCSGARTAQSLLALGADQLESLFEEQPTLQVDCEFCRASYQFTRESLAEAVRGDETPH